MVQGQASQITIGKLARQSGLKASAIRYYEARGLLRPAVRLPNGYRLYDEDSVVTLRFLRRAQGFGITLREIKQLIDLTQRGRKPCHHARKLISQHLAEVEAQIRELEALRKELRSVSRRANNCQASEGQLCPIIESASVSD
jgi:MerR family transcriptional regulator, copper efflux regulator